jgi:phage gp29-like protein
MKKQSVSPAEKAVLTAQIIRDDFSTFLSYMPNPDDVAVGTNAAYRTYREMRTDPRIKSLLNKLKTAALAFSPRITRTEGVREDVYQFVSAQPIFSRNLYQKAKRMLSALDYGFSVTEAVWKEENGAMILDNLITRKPERFVFDYDWNCYWNKSDGRRLLNDPRKWLIFRHDPDDENAYGTSVLRCVFWAWMFKKAGYEFWLMATEKFSVKTILALFEQTGSREDVQVRANEIANLLVNVVSGSSSALGNVKEVKELSMDGHVGEFNALVEACDVQIAYGLTGQAVATNNPENGNRSLGGVSVELLYDEAKGIALELQGVLQKAVNWAVESYFGEGINAPAIEFDVERRASFDEVMKAIESEIPVSKEDLYSYYKLPRPKNDEDQFLKPSMGAETLPGLPERTAAAPQGTDVQATALNGAQVTSLVDLVAQVASKAIPVETGKAIAKASFPLVAVATIDAMFAPLEALKLSDSSGKKKALRQPRLIL